MQAILPLLACVIIKKVLGEGRLYLLIVSDVGFYKVRDTYMESFKSGRYLTDYLVQLLHFLNEAAVVQRGEGTVPRSHSNQHQSQHYKNTSRSRSRRYLINSLQSFLCCELQEQDSRAENTKAHSLLPLCHFFHF